MAPQSQERCLHNRRYRHNRLVPGGLCSGGYMDQMSPDHAYTSPKSYTYSQNEWHNIPKMSGIVLPNSPCNSGYLYLVSLTLYGTYPECTKLARRVVERKRERERERESERERNCTNTKRDCVHVRVRFQIIRNLETMHG